MRAVMWFMPWLGVLLISTSLAYLVDVTLTADANAASREEHPDFAPGVYMGLGIEPQLYAQTPDQTQRGTPIKSGPSR